MFEDFRKFTESSETAQRRMTCSFTTGYMLYDYVSDGWLWASDNEEEVYNMLLEMAVSAYGITRNPGNLSAKALVEMLDIADLYELANYMLSLAEEPEEEEEEEEVEE